MYTQPRGRDLRWMRRAIDLAALCPPAVGAYSVGAVLVGGDGKELASGFSRATGPREHAEEVALDQVDPHDPRLAAATLYSTLEPCSQRSAARVPCARRIIAAGVPRVVTAWREPSLFVEDCVGHELLVDAGVVVVEVPELAEAARAVNAHLWRLD
ncbi:deaminase [Streptomyces sp. SID5789]|uniref:deaminase n=1 Tax=Streptomyces sp. SID5789 TaxID=2690310 RepID=UPI00136DE98B|nr:dCMP deaminase [Streptomyces sp. SID5789]